MSDLAIVPFNEAARGFVREATCRVRWPKNDLPWVDWSYAYGALVDLWLREGKCALADAGDQVYLGFALAHRGLVRMVYVKRDFRGHGLGRELLEAIGTEHPHCPNASWGAWSRGWPTTSG